MRKLWCHIFWQIIKQRSCQRGGILEVLSGEGGGDGKYCTRYQVGTTGNVATGHGGRDDCILMDKLKINVRWDAARTLYLN